MAEMGREGKRKVGVPPFRDYILIAGDVSAVEARG
jgi:hypothetical protein